MTIYISRVQIQWLTLGFRRKVCANGASSVTCKGVWAFNGRYVACLACMTSDAEPMHGLRISLSSEAFSS